MALDIIIKAVIIGGALIVGVGSSLLLRMKKDNPIEQIAEKIIQEETGVEIDFTPEFLEEENLPD